MDNASKEEIRSDRIVDYLMSIAVWIKFNYLKKTNFRFIYDKIKFNEKRREYLIKQSSYDSWPNTHNIPITPSNKEDVINDLRYIHDTIW